MTQEQKEYFAAVFIGDSFWGPIAEEQAEAETGRMFPCGKCTTPDHKVYHNILGQHCHISTADLLKRIESVECPT